MYKIEKGVPEPTGCKYPFDKMDIGDSFEMPPSERKRIIGAAYGYAIRHGKRFSSRKTPEGAVRIWRVE